MRNRLMSSVLVFSLVTLPLVMACERADDEASEASEAAEAPESPSAEAAESAAMATLLKEATVTEAAARTTALARVAGGEVTKVELEKEDNLLIWSLDVKVAGKEGVEEIHIDAKTGAIVKQEHETDAELAAEQDEDDDAEEAEEAASQVELLKEATVTEAAARATALARVAGGEVTKVELEKEDNLLIWSLDVKVAGKEGVEEIHIDAKTGAIVKQEHEGGGGW